MRGLTAWLLLGGIALLLVTLTGMAFAQAAGHDMKSMPGMDMGGASQPPAPATPAAASSPSMPGMDMAAAPATARPPLAVLLALVLFVLLLAGYILVKRTHRDRPSPALLGGLALLLLVYAVTAYIVHTRRNPAQATVLAATMMDMSSTRPVPGLTPVATEKLQAGPFTAKVTYTATIVALNDEDVYPRVVGRLVAAPVYTGDTVRPGQLLARLDDVELSARERQAQAGLATAAAQQTAAAARTQQARAALRRQEAGTTAASAAVTESRKMVAAGLARQTEAEKDLARAKHEVNAARQESKAAQARLDAAQADVEAAQSGIENATADLDAANADLTYWQAEIERMRQLAKGGAASQDELQAEEARYKSAVARVQQTKAGVTERKAGLNAAKARVQEAQAALARAAAEADAAQAETEKLSAAIGTAGAETDVARARLEQAQAEARAAQAEVAGSGAEVRASAAEQVAARAMTRESAAALSVARTVRGYTEIRATARAQVLERVVSPGVLVSPGTLLLRLAQMDRVRVQANVSETDMASVKVGSRVWVTIPGVTAPVGARVTSVAPGADPAARTSVVETILPNPGGRLRPGAAVTMQIETAQAAGAVTVPNTALVPRSGAATGPSSATAYSVWVVRTEAVTGKAVYTCPMHPEVLSDHPGNCPKCGMPLVLKEGGEQTQTTYTCPMHPEVHSDHPGNCPKCGMPLVAKQTGGRKLAHLAAVTVGPSDGQRTQILSGLKSGDEVIVAGYESLTEGQAVQDVPWGPDGPTTLPQPAGAPPPAAGHSGHAP